MTYSIQVCEFEISVTLTVKILCNNLFSIILSFLIASLIRLECLDYKAVPMNSIKRDHLHGSNAYFELGAPRQSPLSKFYFTIQFNAYFLYIIISVKVIKELTFP